MLCLDGLTSLVPIHFVGDQQLSQEDFKFTEISAPRVTLLSKYSGQAVEHRTPHFWPLILLWEQGVESLLTRE
jgi:hypothetical protein